jgi:hypothetical protein
MESGVGAAGSGDPAGVAALEALRQLGVLGDTAWRALGRHALPEVRSVTGEHAGNAQAAFELGARGVGRT